MGDIIKKVKVCGLTTTGKRRGCFEGNAIIDTGDPWRIVGIVLNCVSPDGTARKEIKLEPRAKLYTEISLDLQTTKRWDIDLAWQEAQEGEREARRELAREPA